MSTIPDDRKYTESHEWVIEQDEDVIIVGITDHAQAELGDLVFVDVAEEDSEVGQGDAVTVVESVKAAADIYAPCDGVIVAGNADLEDAAETITNDPYQGGWLFKMTVSDRSQLDSLMDAAAYAKHIGQE